MGEATQKESVVKEERWASEYGPPWASNFKDGERQREEGMIRKEGQGPQQTTLVHETSMFSTCLKYFNLAVTLAAN